MSVVEELEAVKAQLRKARLELTAKLAELNATVDSLSAALTADGGVEVNVANALADLKVVAQELDDLVPDVATLEPVAEDVVPEAVPFDEPVVTEELTFEEEPVGEIVEDEAPSNE